MRMLEISERVLCGLTFLWVASLGLMGKRHAKEKLQSVIQRMADRGRNLVWHERTRVWLERNGAAFHFGDRIDPLSFFLLRFLLALAGLSVFSIWSLAYGCIAAVSLYCLPVVLVLYLNRRDNLQMLPDIKHVYHSLEIQTRAGVFVTDALAELYGSVREKRLKQALLDLSGDLVMRSDLGVALEKFQKRFDNRYLDSLCIILLQAMESGQSVDLLSDLSEQIKDMEAAVLSQKKEALDRSVTFYQLGILVAVMGVLLYACVTQMFAAAKGF